MLDINQKVRYSNVYIFIRFKINFLDKFRQAISLSLFLSEDIFFICHHLYLKVSKIVCFEKKPKKKIRI